IVPNSNKPNIDHAVDYSGFKEAYVQILVYNVLGDFHFFSSSKKPSLNPNPLFLTKYPFIFQYRSVEPVITQEPPQNNFDQDRSLDLKYCGYKDCKFLFAYYPSNRNGKINSNYIDYINIARLLGRTMVLTNVDFGRVSACQEFPFDLYFDVNSLSQRFPDVKFITQYDFQQWSILKSQKPTVSHVYITDGGATNSVENLAPYSDMLKRMWCLDKFGFKLDDTSRFEQLRASWNSWTNQTGRKKLQSYIISNLQHDEDVLLVRSDVREPLFYRKHAKMNYSSYIVDAADKITNGLRPYLAIHWNLENVNLESLGECVKRLVTKVQKLIDNSRIENIYMSTDYPLFDVPIEKSDESEQKSHWTTSPAYHTAINLLKSQISLNNWESLKVFDHLEVELKDKYQNVKEIKQAIIDTGINRIVDRMVCVQADWFVGIPKFPCGALLDVKIAKAIVNERIVLMKEGHPNIKNN
ncbi:14894_t:CDS:2, partial [Acaulospora morrowiae]